MKEYEQNIKEEYLLVLSNDNFKLNSSFLSRYKDAIDVCRTFEDFVKESNITSIVIPIFIAHGDGNKDKVESFLDRLNRVNTDKILE